MSEAPTAGSAAKSATLDDIMIAMDVVDTMRHREDLVARELNDAGREAELIARLKAIYHQQGIEVPDSVLAEGVKALKESRFTYTPPPPGWKRTAYEMWTKRRTYGSFAGAAVVVLLGTCSYQHFTVTRPAQIAQEQERVELADTLPKAIRQAHADVLTAAPGDRTARERAAASLADGERAIRDKDRAQMQKTAAELKALRDDVLREYTLTIISRQGETSGIRRRPPAGSQTQNYYLVVEAIAPNGQRLSLPIRNEENGVTQTVDKFGVRVPQSIFDQVAADKRDDGIIQKSHFATKKRGTLTIDYLMPFEGGMITKW